MRRLASVVLLVSAHAVAAACHSASRQPVTISDSSTGAYEAALAVRDGGFVAAWYDTRDGNAEIYMRLLDNRGQPAAPERRLTQSPEDSYEASVAVIDDRIAVAWYDKSAGGRLTARLGVWQPDGTNDWVVTLADTSRNPVVRATADRLFCAWIAPDPDGREFVWAGWWTRDGTQAGTSIRVAPASSTTWNLNVVAAGSEAALVAFDAAASTIASELFLAHVSPAASRVARLTADDGVASKYPDIADGPRLAVTWFDERDGNEEVYLLVLDPVALDRADTMVPLRVTNTPGESIGAYVAWNGVDRLGLAWSDAVDAQHEIFFQDFSADGVPRSGARRVTTTSTSSLIPAIVPSPTGFALAWNEYEPSGAQHDGRSQIAFALVP